MLLAQEWSLSLGTSACVVYLKDAMCDVKCTEQFESQAPSTLEPMGLPKASEQCEVVKVFSLSLDSAVAGPLGGSFTT